MDGSTLGIGNGVEGIAPEFNAVPVQGEALESVNAIRVGFDTLLATVEKNMPVAGASPRYLALTKTKLEEACMFATKGVAIGLNN